MKATTCSRNSNVQRNWKNREKRIVDQIDKRSRSGESATDDNFVNRHMSISEEGDRCWSF